MNLVVVFLLFWLLMLCKRSSSWSLPLRRKLIPLDTSSIPPKVSNNLRVLQFNVLADGLSGLRADLGGFSRAKPEFMQWDYRRNLLLAEILQYQPNIITLQECDHFYDFFLPMLATQGYEGIFAPKPASACLEVSKSSDGCAIFYRSEKIKVLSSEIGTYALSRTELKGLTPDYEKRIQNQVYIMIAAEILNQSSSLIEETAGTEKPSAAATSSSRKDKGPVNPLLLLATTHLKASKTEEGERFRLLELKQLLETLTNFEKHLMVARGGVRPAVIVTGDFNACPPSTDDGHTSPRVSYPSSVYEYMKNHDFQFRSVLNDDLFVSSSSATKNDGQNDRPTVPYPWTTWKARKRGDKETIVKHCIDYIWYRPSGMRAVAVLEGFTDEEVDASHLLPSPSYPSDHISLVADLEVVVQFDP